MLLPIIIFVYKIVICQQIFDYVYYSSDIYSTPCIYNYILDVIYRKQNYVGEVKFSSIDVDVTTKRLYVATKKNVVASLAIDTGKTGVSIIHNICLIIIILVTIR